MEGIMSKEIKPTSLTLPIYALPQDTDPEILTRLACDLAEDLEVMGVFDQRDSEPAHFFAALNREIDE